MTAAWIRAIIILPGTVLVTVPAVLLHFTDYHWPEGHRLPWLAAGGLTLTAGLALAVWTMQLFAAFGQGTAAPWNPPKRLIIIGPYRHVRNPMITSVLAMLAGEALLTGSPILVVWLLVFFLINAIYFPLIEEKELARRFGDAYIEYRRNVPRWLPRLSPWMQPFPWEEHREDAKASSRWR